MAKRSTSWHGKGYRGRYLLHCHNLEHEDHSMMARIDVI
jgi:spore coat protein A, manganese oxidase